MRYQRWLVYDRFPDWNALSEVNILEAGQVHNAASERQIIQLEMFTLAVNIMSSDEPRRPVAWVRVPLRFWIYVLTGRARPELHVIHQRMSSSPRKLL